MEANYDKEKARECLERLIGEGKQEDEVCLHHLLEEPEWFETVRIKELVKDKVFSLVHSGADGQASDEECVFTVYGAMTKKDLPPLKTSMKNINGAKAKFLKQHVRLDGLGTPEFTSAIGTIQGICKVFDRIFEEGELEQWKDGLSVDENKQLDMSSKLFTPASDARGAQHVPFDTSSDPSGVMDAFLQKGYIRTEDNVVQFSEGKLGLEGKKRYERIGPQAFRIGDLVAAQISFKAIVMHGQPKRCRMIIVLCSLTLLAKSFTFKTPVKTASAPVAVTLKRKLRSLEDPEVNDVGDRMGAMQMDTYMRRQRM
ncbi:hypothetical protein DXG01_005545 [Tephrocybe rancida]|nr:hypothetical protein DXG01_005545 [Tephrocybe rancida]